MKADISLETKKIELIQWLSNTDNTDLLDKVLEIMNLERKSDWWLTTPNIEMDSIEKGLQDANNGKLNPHSKARNIYGKWL